VGESHHSRAEAGSANKQRTLTPCLRHSSAQVRHFLFDKWQYNFISIDCFTQTTSIIVISGSRIR
jgi:hypothetical protein